MELTQFYSAVAQLSFTLFGVWFLVVELGPDELLGRPALRRTTFHVSLGFLVPGVLALGSLLAVETLAMWRIVFGIGGVAGAVANVRLALSEDASAATVPIGTWWTAGVVYVLFAVVALFRPSITFGDVALAPLTQEGVLVTVQMLIGSFAAWRVFTMPRPDPDQPS
jgi:hypothetical protein